MKYFRSYPWGMQLLLFLMMIITMIGFGTYMLLTFLPKFTPYTLAQIEVLNEHSPSSLVGTSMVVQAILSLCVFLIPGWLFAHLTHPCPAEYLGLRAPGKWIQLILVVLVMLGAMPLFQLIQNIIGQINFSAKIKADQAASEAMMNAYLNMPTFSTFIRGLVIMAVIPAVGEEFFFRGVLLRFARKKSRNMVMPILFTSFFFAYSHTNIYGYLSIFLAGALLAVIYNVTGSLWCGIVAHFCFNATQVVLSYMGNSNAAVKAFITSTSVPYGYVLAGAVVFSISLYLLLKNKTPLPTNWSDDFPPDAPKNEDWDFMAKS